MALKVTKKAMSCHAKNLVIVNSKKELYTYLIDTDAPASVQEIINISTRTSHCQFRLKKGNKRLSSNVSC